MGYAMSRVKKLSIKEPAISEQDVKTLHPEYEAFLQWKRTRKTKESTLLTMKRRFLHFPPPDGLLVEYFDKRLDEVNSNKTVKLELTYARAFLRWAKRDFSHLEGFDVGKMEETVTKTDLYTAKDLIKIFEHAEPLRDRPMLQVLYETAVRPSELLSMTFDSVRWTCREYLYYHGREE